MADLLDSLEPLVRPYVEDCAPFLIKAALRRSAQKFFKESHLWKQELIVVVPSTFNKGVINLNDDSALVAVTEVKNDQGQLLQPALEKSSLRACGGRPTAFFVSNDGYIHVGPVPNDDVLLTVSVELKPAIAANTIPDYLIELYGDTLAEGAVMYLCRTPGNEWSSPDQSMLAERQFYKGLRAALNDAEGGLSSVSERAYSPVGFV